MKPPIGAILLFLAVAVPAAIIAPVPTRNAIDTRVSNNAQAMLDEGRKTFRYDTFGSEAFWGDTLQLHQAIAGAKHGGVGDGVSPAAALAVGLKVDADALPADLKARLKAGLVDLADPATTLALVKLNAVIGVVGFSNPDGSMRSIGLTCAVCHATVDDSFAPGIGSRLDGWANRDLDVGAIVSLAPNLKPYTDLLGVDLETLKKVLGSWGPGCFDAALDKDGIAMRPDGKRACTMIPPAFGLAGVNLHAWAGSHDTRGNPDLSTAKLPALHFYQLALVPPEAKAGSFDAAAAARGKSLFTAKGDCARCHVPPIFTEPGHNLRAPAEIGIDAFQADRSPTRMYRVAPLAGLWTHQKGGFYHDGRFGTLADVVDHYDAHFKLELSDTEKSDLIEYLKGI